MTRPNPRLVRVGDELAHILATQVTAALDHIAEEIAHTTGLPDHTPGAPEPVVALPYLEQRQCPVCKGRGWTQTDGWARTPCDNCDAAGTTKLTQTERSALRRYELEARRDDIRDLLDAFEQLRDSLRTECDAALRTRVADVRTEKGTCYADPTLDGYLIPLDEGGWFDPTCKRISRTVKAGLCDACRKRLERYREQHGLRPLQDDRDVRHDSQVRIVDGVAIVREAS